jgi:two-component system chemotaxis response regulator CheB
VRTVKQAVATRSVEAQLGKLGPPTNQTVPAYPLGLTLRKKHGYTKVVAIGCSTGGPNALNEILQKFPEDFPAPILVVQHMPEKFTGKLAELLNHRIALRVVEAKEGMDIQEGMVYIAPGAYHMKVLPNRTISLQPVDSPAGPCPSVDIMMQSAAKVFGKNTIGVILTGMGNDGVVGMNAIKDVKGITIAQDEETSLVFGMPRMAIESGCVDAIVPLPQVSDEIMKSLWSEN